MDHHGPGVVRRLFVFAGKSEALQNTDAFTMIRKQTDDDDGALEACQW